MAGAASDVPAQAVQAIQVTDLRTEYTSNPLGIDETSPRLSWKLTSSERGQYQTAYAIQVASSEQKLLDNHADIWDTGKVASEQSANITYEGKPLASGQRYFWRVQVWDKSGSGSSGWSEPAWWEMGLLDEADWQADWIGKSEKNNVSLEGMKWVWYPEGNPAQAAPAENRYFRKTIDLPSDRKIAQGKFIITADDGFVLYVNGKRVAGSIKATDSWKEGMMVDVSRELLPGTNKIAIQTTNDNGPAGLIGGMKVFFEEGEPLQFNLDQGLKASKVKYEGWEKFDFDDSGWVSALAMTVYGSQPWGKNVQIPSSPPYIRKGFTVEKKVTKARLYSTALGVYEPYINGTRVGKDLLAPGWTDYNKRIQYQTYDVTDLLQDNDNVIGAILAEGWYSGHIGFVGPHIYGDKPYLFMQLELEYADGSTETIGTDSSWKWMEGPIVSSSILMGETYDAGKELPGWSAPGYDETGWDYVEILNEAVAGKLVAQDGPTVQAIEEIKPIAMTEPEPGKYVFDLGQNMVGTVRLKVNGEAGRTVTLRHAEVLNPDGTFYTANLRGAKATDHYTLKGGGEEVFEPRFTFHGFRYVEVSGYPGVPTMDAITGIVIHTAAPFTGEFETSSPMINQLQSNITWGQRGNFLEVPTDTPARDERMGWTGDINVFIGTATYNMDVAKFIGSKWLRDLRDGQSADGAYPDVAPDVCCYKGNAGWADAGVTVPYAIWQRYGDIRVVEENFEEMADWIEYMKKNSSGYIRPSSSYGDWLDVNDPTPGDLISTAYFAYSTKLVSIMARAIGRDDDADYFERLFEEVKVAYNKAYVADDGSIRGNSQTAYVLSLYMDLLPESKRQAAADHLVKQIENRDWHLSTGFLGTRDLLPVLSETGHLDVAYRLLNNDTFPSWGYQIKNGATTMWERWDSIKPDGSFQDIGMNSFNHYAYGAVGDWMYRNIAGIQHDPANPGYKHILIKPLPGGNLTSARGSYDSIYGTITSDWKMEGDTIFKHHITIPVNTTATVYIPADSQWSVTESGQFAHLSPGVQFVGMENGNAVYTIGSGEYQFTVDPLIGKLGAALDETEKLIDHAAGLSETGELTAELTQYLNDHAEELVHRLEASIASYLQDEDELLNEQVHSSLEAANGLQNWILEQKTAGRMSAGAADALSRFVSAAAEALSMISAEMLGIKLSIAPSQETVLPGDDFTVEATIANDGDISIRDVSYSVQKPEGWAAEPIGSAAAAEIKPGESFTARYRLTVSEDQSLMNAMSIAGTVNYAKDGAVASVPLKTSIVVVSPISITAMSAAPGSLEPGDPTMISVTVHNKGSVSAQGQVHLQIPDQWEAGLISRQYSLEAGEEKTLSFKAYSPLEATAKAVELHAVAFYNGDEADQASATVKLSPSTPPPVYYDHVDAGDQKSEQEHNVKASPTSGTNTEEGLTRRYVRNGVANGYFEYDMKVEPGEPFIIRATETYDRAQIKDYYVFVNGTKVHTRYNQTNSKGIVTYQFIVDDPLLSKDGIVTVRFQEDEEGRNYDPSIADVWTMPLNVKAVELQDISNKQAGEQVTIAGHTSLDSIIVKVLGPDQSVLYSNELPGGEFGDSFTLPKHAAVGTYTVLAGIGASRAVKSFEVAAASEQDIVTLTGKAVVTGGEETEFTVGVEGLRTSFTALDATFQYDPKMLEFDTVAEGNYLSLESSAIQSLKQDFIVIGSSVKPEQGQIRILMASMGDQHAIIHDGDLFALRGKVKDEAPIGSASAKLTGFVVSRDGTEFGLDLSHASLMMKVTTAERLALAAAIEEAQAIHDAAVEGTQPGQYPHGSKAALQAAIDSAAAVYHDANATKEQVAAALQALNTAVLAFANSVNPDEPVDRTALDAAIAAAQSKHDRAVEGTKVGQYKLGSKAILQTAIHAAGNAGGSQAQVDEAVIVLNEAVKAFAAKLVTMIEGQTKVTIRDLAIVARYYGTTSADANWHEIEKADVVGANEIDIRVLVAIARMILEE